MLNLLLRRVTEAFGRTPTSADWLEAGLLIALAAWAALPFGLRHGFLRRERARVSPGRAVGVALACFVAPALAEETVFRVLLVPRFAPNASLTTQALWAVVSVAAFVIYHPLKARLLPGRGHAVFTSPVFLQMTAIISLTCYVSYIRSGSVWPPVVIHWVCAVTWLLSLGGLRQMNRDVQG